MLAHSAYTQSKMWVAHGDRDLPYCEALYCEKCDTVLFQPDSFSRSLSCPGCANDVIKKPGIHYTLVFWYCNAREKLLTPFKD